MATSGALSTSNSNIKYKITITQNSRNIANNTSSVTVSVRFYRTNTGYTTYGSGTVYCKINGTTYSESVTSSDKITSSGIVLFSKTLNITHDADGGKKLTTSAWINHDQFSAKEQSYSEELITIPRTTTPTVSDNDIDLGTSITISTPRASSAFTHTLKYTFGGSTATIATGVGTSRAWTPPVSLATKIPNATSGKLTIICETYSGSTKIGSKSIVITVRVPSSVVPTISSVAVTDTNTAQYEKMGGVVKGKSKLSVKITASGAHGSTISSISTTGGGKTYSGATFTVNSITTAGTLTFTVTVKDSRGRSAKTTKSVTVVDYENPVITKFSVIRANSDGTPNDEGSSLLISYGFNISPVNNKNDKSFTISMKPADGTSFTTLLTGSAYTADTTLIPAGIINSDMTYTIRLKISDYFRSITHDIEAPTAFTLVDYHTSGKGLAFGKVAQEEGVVDFGLKAKFNNGENSEGAIAVLSGTDIDTLVDPGHYVFSSATSTTLLNLPFTASGSGSIEISREGDANQVRQRVTRCSVIREVWERLYYSNKWQPWEPLHKSERVLWSGGMYMTGGHKIALSEPVSKQQKGIVLVFSRYENGAVADHNVNSFFIPKEVVRLLPGVGHSFQMNTVNFSMVATKYLYINDSTISGNDSNDLEGTSNGVTYNNSAYVLRYVIGV